MSDTTESTTPEQQRAALEAMRLAELQALAADLQIVGAGKLRKGELVDAVTGAREGVVAVPPTGRRRGSRRVSATDPSEFAGAELAPGAPAAEDGRRRAVDHAAGAVLPELVPVDDDAEPDAELEADAAAEDAVADGLEASTDAEPDDAESADAEPADAGDGADAADGTDGEPQTTGSRSRRSRSRNRNGGQAQQGGQPQSGQPGGAQQAAQRDGDDDRAARTSRTRDRKRGRGPAGDEIEPEILEDDVLIPIAGILDVLENYAFVRTTGYLPGPTDVYVSLGQVKKYGLRKGDAVVGAIRQPRDNEPQGRQKYNALAKVDSINGQGVDQATSRPEFAALTAISPTERLRLETTPDVLSTRIVDLFAPIGKGQRGLVVSPPKAGKTVVLQSIAEAVAKNNPEVHLMVVLVDARPEEVTEFQRAVKGEVIASTFDRSAEDHTTIAELAIERAKRLVELGHDVVVLLDSITRLGRAYNVTAPAAVRAIAGAVDAAALSTPKRFFGAARNLEEGGSLTIIATALVDSGSKADEVIFEEFDGASNMELRLSRALADQRRYPAVDLVASGTRREERLLGADEVAVISSLRRTLAGQDEQHALESVVGRLAETGSNVEYLMLVQKSTPAAR